MSLKDVVLLLLGPPVSFMLGYMWHRLRVTIAHRRARQFWRPMLSGGLSVVLGQHRTLYGFERSGVIGIGAIRAFTEVVRHFDSLGFHDYVVHYTDEVGWRDGEDSSLRHNLVLIGGPDANEVTRAVLSVLHTRTHVVYLHPEPTQHSRPNSEVNASEPARVTEAWTIPAFIDDVTGTVYSPSRVGADPVMDVGVVIRAPNPFNPRAEVVVLAGAYGHGTLAASRLVLSKEFLGGLPKHLRYLEALVTVNVVQDDPQEPRVSILRAAGAPPRDRRRSRGRR